MADFNILYSYCNSYCNCLYDIITSERNECSSYYQSYMGRLDDIETAFETLKH